MSDVIEPAEQIKDKKYIFDRKGNWQNLGSSAGGHPVIYKHLRSNKGVTRFLLLGGVHGNETEGIQFMHDFCCEFIDCNIKSPFEEEILAIPVVNPDGFLNYERKNANGVDLNRNMPTEDWSQEYSEEKFFPGEKPNSEPESQQIVNIIERYQPCCIISFHSWKPIINYNGPSLEYAKKIAAHLNMVITNDIGYPTPGSLGTYSGLERKIPTITLEFTRGTPLQKIYPFAKNGILTLFNRIT